MGISLADVGPEVWIAATYCLALVTLAHVIDALARRAASASEGGRVGGGFTYHEDHDAWKCPEDQWLWPQSFDPDNRVMRYRGTPSICNSCPVKDTCTPSNSGREVQRTVDVWPASEAARFHRSIACVVVTLGLVWPTAVALSGPSRSELVVLCAAIVLATLASIPLWSHLRRNAVFIPEGMKEKSLDAVQEEREAAAADLIRRRSSYRSDRRDPGEQVAR